MSAKNPGVVQLKNTYIRPHGDLGRKIIICGIVMVLSARQELIAPGSPLYDYVLARSANALRAATWIQNGLFYFLFGAHSIETVIFAYAKLAKHGVSFFSLAWWQWMVTCLVGGKFCFEHFEQVITKKATGA